MRKPRRVHQAIDRIQSTVRRGSFTRADVPLKDTGNEFAMPRSPNDFDADETATRPSQRLVPRSSKCASRRSSFTLLVISLSPSTDADVVAKSSAGFVSKHVLNIAAPPQRVFRRADG